MRHRLVSSSLLLAASLGCRTGLPQRIVHEPSGIVMVLIPAGEFMMGSPVGEADRSEDEGQHRRVIREPFYLGETEVTVAQFRRFVEATGYQTDAERGVEESGNTRGAFSATPDGNRAWAESASWRNPFPHFPERRLQEDQPVVHVSWNDAVRFAEHHGLQLPTEAQWEHAARLGGAQGMVGNVSEWCQDVYRDYPADGTDERAAEGESGAARVLRGSSWVDSPDFERPAKRLAMYPQSRRDFIGFRVAMPASKWRRSWD